MTNTLEEAILKTLKRAPKKGLTASQIADRAGLNINSTRTTLNGMTGLKVVGKVETKSAGRPAYLYAI